MIVTIQNNINLVEIAEKITDRMKAELKEWGPETTLEIRNSPNFPFDTGALNRGIKGQFIETEKGANYTIVADVPYAAYQEFGTILRFDSSYTSGLGLTNYASQFKGAGIIKSGGVRSRQFFFRPVRSRFEILLQKLRESIV